MVKKTENSYLNNLVKILFLNLFLLPIYPDNFKPSVLALFTLSAIIFFIKKDRFFNLEKGISLLFINSLPFLISLLSLIYTNNISYAGNLIVRLLPLFLIPLSFYLLKSNKIIFTKKILVLSKWLFYLSTLLFFIAIFCYFFYKGFVTKNYFLNYSYRIIYQLGSYSIHPIYASIYVSIALIFSVSLFKEKKYKIFLCIGNIILALNLLLLSRKSAIFIMIILFFTYLFYNKIVKLRTKLIAVLSMLVLVVSIFKFTPDISNRFNDLTSFIKQDNNKSSSNLRLNIYKTAIPLIKEKAVIGYGLGSGEEVLFKKEKENSYFKNKGYNSHNQFLGFALNTGLIGLIFFLFFLFKNFKLAFLNSFEHTAILFFFILLMFIENILDRQNGILFFSLFVNYFAFRITLNKKL